MAITWNNITLKVLVGTFRPGIPSASVNEIPLIPDAADLDAVATVLQQGSTGRKRVSGKLYLSSMTDYNTLVTAWLAGTTGTLADDDTLNATYMIESLGEPEYQQINVIFANIVFVEV